MFLRSFGLGVFAFEISQRHVQGFVPEADWMMFIDATSANFRLADHSSAKESDPQKCPESYPRKSLAAD